MWDGWRIKILPCVAYVVTGSYKAGNTRTGLGDGPIVTAQYQF